MAIGAIGLMYTQTSLVGNLKRGEIVTEIIAEVGSNWESKKDCMESIAKAKACGANIVKFQLFTAEELYGFEPVNPWVHPAADMIPKWGPKTANHPELPRDWIPQLKEKADACGIEFMCTPFSEDGVKFLDPYVKRWKIASSDSNHYPLLEAVARTGKPVILSVGATGLQDIKKAVTCLDAFGCDHITVMYCSAEYPARYVDLRKIDLICQEIDPTGIGYSDHSSSVIEIPLAACDKEGGYGVDMLEKHFKIREMATPDNAHALDPEDFKLMVDAIKGEYHPTLNPIPAEKDMVLKHNRRLIACKDIKRGEQFVYGENFGCYRSLVEETSALGPGVIFNNGAGAPGVQGRVASKDYNQGEGIGPEALQ